MGQNSERQQPTDDEKVDVDDMKDTDLNKIPEIGKNSVVLVVATTVVELEKKDWREVIAVAVCLLSKGEMQGRAKDVGSTSIMTLRVQE